MTCIEPGCKLCSGDECRACGNASPRPCHHDIIERHAAIRAISDADKIPTKKIEPLLGARLTFELSHPDDVARLFETMARIARTKRQITVIVE